MTMISKTYYMEKWHDENPFISGILRPATGSQESIGVWHGLCLTKVIDFGTMEKSMREEVRTSLGPGERESYFSARRSDNVKE